MPADGGGVEENLGALHRGETGAFREPLIPADQRADRRHLRLPRDEAGVAGREIELLVEQRVVRNVHLAIDAHQRSVGVDHRGGVVIHARGAPLEQRRDDHRLVLLRQLAEGVGRRARNGLGEREEAMVFDLAEILASGTAPGCRRSSRPSSAPVRRARAGWRDSVLDPSSQAICESADLDDWSHRYIRRSRQGRLPAIRLGDGDQVLPKTGEPPVEVERGFPEPGLAHHVAQAMRR